MRGKGEKTMMAAFFAQRVLLGRTAFEDVPAKLKDQVAALLEEARRDAGVGSDEGL